MKRSYLVFGFVALLTAASCFAEQSVPVEPNPRTVQPSAPAPQAPGLGSLSANGGIRHQAATHGAAASRVVARVNGIEITLSDLVRKMRHITMQSYRRKELTPEISAQIRKKAIDRLVVEELAYQRAKALGIMVSDEQIEQRMARLKQGPGGEEHFRKTIAMQGLTEEDVRREVGRYLAVQTAIAREVDEKINIREDDVRKAYEEMKEQFVQPEKVVVTDVVFFLDPGERESVRKAESILARIEKELEGDPGGLSSDGTYVVRSGVSLNDEKDHGLYKAAKKLKEGELSGVITVDGTIHILKLIAYRPRRVKSENEVRPYLESMVKRALKREGLEKWKADLKEGAEIEVYEFTAVD